MGTRENLGCVEVRSQTDELGAARLIGHLTAVIICRVSGDSIHYRLRRSRRARRLRIVVRADGVEVVAPHRMRIREIEAFVQSKNGWIRDRVAASLERGLSALPPQCVDGAKVLLRGEKYALWVEPADRKRVRVDFGDGFRAQVPRVLSDAERESAVRSRLTAWLRGEARRDAESLLTIWGERLGVQAARLRIGNQRTLWGSCSARGTISLNWRLIAAPRTIFEYVVVHELCHLRELNHGPAFWELVASQLPDYRERRAWLKRRGVGVG